MKNQSTNWIDISQPLTNSIGHWPGDTPFHYEVAFRKSDTGSVNIGKMTTSLHTGTHIDAPFHFLDEGQRVLDLDINLYIGKARIVDVTNEVEIDKKLLQTLELQGTERLLLKTQKRSLPNEFPLEIPYLNPDIAPFLREQGIFLVGVDIPSVDPLTSKELKTHHALHQNGIHILENVLLENVLPGNYELIALPLPLVEADGSPVRAVIRPIPAGGEEIAQ